MQLEFSLRSVVGAALRQARELARREGRHARAAGAFRGSNATRIDRRATLSRVHRRLAAIATRRRLDA